jgi:hypothetical protein
MLGVQGVHHSCVLRFVAARGKIGVDPIGKEREPDRVSLVESRLGQNKQHGLVPLLRQSIYSRLAGYEDVNDAERLCVGLGDVDVTAGRFQFPDWPRLGRSRRIQLLETALRRRCCSAWWPHFMAGHPVFQWPLRLAVKAKMALI